jgi:hypothetical protein
MTTPQARPVALIIAATGLLLAGPELTAQAVLGTPTLALILLGRYPAEWRYGPGANGRIVFKSSSSNLSCSPTK